MTGVSGVVGKASLSPKAGRCQASTPANTPTVTPEAPCCAKRLCRFIDHHRCESLVDFGTTE